jgi:hypothetical protein
MSPRFHGASGQHPFYGRPEEVSRDLLQSLQKGMYDLRHLKKENVDPHANSAVRMQQPSQMDRTYRSEYGQINLDQLPPYLSMMITNPNAKEDIMNMGMDELDTLKLQNEDRIKQIEERYF